MSMEISGIILKQILVLGATIAIIFIYGNVKNIVFIFK